ncbi:TPA: hypothetical protein JD192_21470, partial [Cronobacter sakazakii]|nr:hypothetical protein [Cronobacter sakazakii]
MLRIEPQHYVPCLAPYGLPSSLNINGALPGGLTATGAFSVRLAANSNEDRATPGLLYGMPLSGKACALRDFVHAQNHPSAVG